MGTGWWVKERTRHCTIGRASLYPLEGFSTITVLQAGHHDRRTTGVERRKNIGEHGCLSAWKGKILTFSLIHIYNMLKTNVLAYNFPKECLLWLCNCILI